MQFATPTWGKSPGWSVAINGVATATVEGAIVSSSTWRPVSKIIDGQSGSSQQQKVLHRITRTISNWNGHRNPFYWESFKGKVYLWLFLIGRSVSRTDVGELARLKSGDQRFRNGNRGRCKRIIFHLVPRANFWRLIGLTVGGLYGSIKQLLISRYGEGEYGNARTPLGSVRYSISDDIRKNWSGTFRISILPPVALDWSVGEQRRRGETRPEGEWRSTVSQRQPLKVQSYHLPPK